MNRRIVLRLLVCLSVSAILYCATVMTPQLLRPGADATAPSVVVIKSSDNDFYTKPLQSFLKRYNGTVTVFSDPATNPSAMARSVRELKPGIVFVLGAQAALFAKQNITELPVIFALVLNYRRLDFPTDKNMCGISVEPPPLAEFTQIKMVVPKLRHVLYMHSSSVKDDVIKGMNEQLEQLDIVLVDVVVNNQASVEAAYKANVGKIDGVWITNDPVLMNNEAFKYLRDQALHDAIPVFTSLSDKFAEAGALMSVAVDLTSFGSQVASLVRSLQRGKTPAQVGVSPPIGVKLTVNQKVADDLHLDIPRSVLPLIHRLILPAAPK